MRTIPIYAINYYEDKYFIRLFAHFKINGKYIPQFYTFIKNKHKELPNTIYIHKYTKLP